MEADLTATGENSGMTSAAAAADMARDCGARRLVLSHLNAELAHPDARKTLLREVAESFTGEVAIGQELTALELCQPSRRNPRAI